MQELTEINNELIAVREAQAAAKRMLDQLTQKPEYFVDISLAMRMSLPNFDQNYPQGITNVVLQHTIRDNMRSNLPDVLSKAMQNLRVREKALCEEVVRLAAKTAAGGL